MSTDKPQKISIGFLGGQTLAAKVSSADLAEMQQALRAENRFVYELTAEDGIITLDLAKVVYVLADHDANRVGFGS
ncbi:MAG: hypothetical protein ACYDHH_01205 [Solirubrobacteraceae bacterium]